MKKTIYNPLLILSLILLFNTIDIYGQGLIVGKKGKPISYAEWRYNRWFQTNQDLLDDVKKTTNRDVSQPYIKKAQLHYDTSTTILSKSMALQSVSKAAYPEVAVFFEEVIRKDTSEDIRCDAIKYLGLISAKESLPFLLELAKDSSLSCKEKVRLAAALAILKEYKVSEQLLNENCYTEDRSLYASCMDAYFKIRQPSSIDFYRFYIKQLDTIGYVGFCWQLVMLGDMQIPYDIAVSYLHHPNEKYRASAVRALIFIDDKKSNKLVESMRSDSSVEVQRIISMDLDRNKKRYMEEVLGKKPKEKKKEKKDMSYNASFSKSSPLYNADAAIAYSDMWALREGEHRYYIDYRTQNLGNCANFVSQCLVAGGLDLTAGTNGAGAWVTEEDVIVNVEALVKHLQKYQNITYSTTTDISGKEPADIIPGDPVFYGGRNKLFEHSLFCAKVDGNGYNLYNAHTNERYHRPKSHWE